MFKEICHTQCLDSTYSSPTCIFQSTKSLSRDIRYCFAVLRRVILLKRVILVVVFTSVRSSGTDNEVHRIQQLCLGSRVENNREMIQDPRSPFQNVLDLDVPLMFLCSSLFFVLFFVV